MSAKECKFESKIYLNDEEERVLPAVKELLEKSGYSVSWKAGDKGMGPSRSTLSFSWK